MSKFNSLDLSNNKLSQFKNLLLKQENKSDSNFSNEHTFTATIEKDISRNDKPFKNPVLKSTLESPSKRLGRKEEVIVESDFMVLELSSMLMGKFTVPGLDFSNKLNSIRTSIFQELGIEIAPIQVAMNDKLGAESYNVKVCGADVANGELRDSSKLAFLTPSVNEDIDGELTKDPIYGENAIWIEEYNAEAAKTLGYFLIEHDQLVATHLNVLARKHLHEVVSRQSVKNSLIVLSNTHPVLFEEIKEQNIRIAKIQAVIQNLVKESLPLNKEFPKIIEAIIDGHEINNKIDDLTNFVRERMSRSVCHRYKSENGHIDAILIDKSLEDEFIIHENNGVYSLNLSLDDETLLIKSVLGEGKKATDENMEITLVVSSPKLRSALSRLIHKYNINIYVMSLNEFVPEIPLTSFSTLKRIYS